MSDARTQAIQDLRAREAARLQKQIATETHRGFIGELRWNSNDAPVPMSCFRDAGLEAPVTQEAAIKTDTERVVKAYKASRAKHGYSSEERAEMRAAFGPSAKVVDVFTGKRVKL